MATSSVDSITGNVVQLSPLPPRRRLLGGPTQKGDLIFNANFESGKINGFWFYFN